MTNSTAPYRAKIILEPIIERREIIEWDVAHNTKEHHGKTLTLSASSDINAFVIIVSKMFEEGWKLNRVNHEHPATN